MKHKRKSAGASQVVLVVKNPPASAGDVRDTGLIPGSERSPGRGCGDPLQYSRLENPMDRGAWQATVHGVAKSRTHLKRLSTGGQSASQTLSGMINIFGRGRRWGALGKLIGGNQLVCTELTVRPHQNLLHRCEALWALETRMHFN